MRALLRHHHLLSEGKEDGPEMEQVEEVLSQLWDKLDEAQQQQMRGQLGPELDSQGVRASPEGAEP